MLPAKIYLDHVQYGSIAYITHEGLAVAKRNFEILVPEASYVWQSEENGEVPYRAFEVGKTQSGEILYLGRGKHEGAIIPGKVQPSQNCLFIPFNGTEVSLLHYEVLCSR